MILHRRTVGIYRIAVNKTGLSYVGNRMVIRSTPSYVISDAMYVVSSIPEQMAKCTHYNIDVI